MLSILCGFTKVLVLKYGGNGAKHIGEEGIYNEALSPAYSLAVTCLSYLIPSSELPLLPHP